MLQGTGVKPGWGGGCGAARALRQPGPAAFALAGVRPAQGRSLAQLWEES